MSRLIIAAAILYCCNLCAREPIPITEIAGYGIFKAVYVRDAILDDTMPVTTVDEADFTDFTDRIPPSMGTSFGFQYVIYGPTKRRPVDVQHVIRVPEPGMRSPGGKVHKEIRSSDQAVIGRKVLHGYAFDESWEIVPGEWIFEVWRNDVKLISKSFVVLPREHAHSEPEQIAAE